MAMAVRVIPVVIAMIPLPILSVADTEHICKKTVEDFPVYLDDSKKCACPNKRSDFFYYPCDSHNSSCFRCLNSTNDVVISGMALCDMIIDCPDLTDEILCTRNLPLNYSFRNEDKTNFGSTRSSSLCELLEDSDSPYFCQGNISELRKETEDCTWNEKNISESSLKRGEQCRCIDSMNDSIRTCGYYIVPNVHWVPYKWLKDKRWAIVMGLVIGTVAILGNVTVIFIAIKDLRERHAMFTREEKLTKYSFLSLSISDMIVAISTVALCSILHDFRNNNPNLEEYGSWITSCNVVGTLTMIGSEQSVFTMVLIALSRFWGIVRPFSRIPLKPYSIALLLTWLLSILLSMLPCMPALEEVFVTDIVQPKAPLLTRIQYRNIVKIMQRYNNASQEYTRKGDDQDHSWSELRSYMNTLFDIKESYNVGYYNGFMLCVPNLFPKYHLNSMVFSLFIFILNSICFIFMVVGYVRIYKNQKQSRRNRKINQGNGESQRLRLKIFLILVTDFICWIPVCMLGLANIIYTEIWLEYCDLGNLVDNIDASLYVMILVQPINSALNPFVYSASPEHLRRYFSLFITSIKCKCWPDRDESSTVSKSETGRVSVSRATNDETDQHQGIQEAVIHFD